jgi:hypothetical protein
MLINYAVTCLECDIRDLTSFCAIDPFMKLSRREAVKAAVCTCFNTDPFFACHES